MFSSRIIYYQIYFDFRRLNYNFNVIYNVIFLFYLVESVVTFKFNNDFSLLKLLFHFYILLQENSISKYKFDMMSLIYLYEFNSEQNNYYTYIILF